MDLKSIKELAARRPAIWLPCVMAWPADYVFDAAKPDAERPAPVPTFELQVRRMSLLEIDKINREANDLALVDGLVHAVTNEQRLIKSYLDHVVTWRGVQVQHILAPSQIDGSEYAATDVVPFDRELLDTLLTNYPVLIKELSAGLFKSAYSHALEVAEAKKNS